MKPVLLKDVRRIVKGRFVTAACGGWARGVSTDSRTIKSGDLFVAIQGEKFDGHDFIGKAAEGGACGAIVSHEVKRPSGEFVMIGVEDTVRALGELAGWWRRGFHGLVVGITGSVGKTTTKELAYHVISPARRTVQADRSFNNAIGVPLTILEATDETEVLILEMGTSAPGEIARLAEIADVDIGVILNVAPAHLEGLGSIAGVARAKAELLEALTESDRAIINSDDTWVRKVAPVCLARLVTFGTGAYADFRADSIEQTLHGWRFQLNGREPVELNVPGRHNVYNALAAIAIAREAGIEAAEAVRALGSFRLPPLRMERTVADGVVIYNDSYNSNPASLRAAIDQLCAEAASGRKVLVVGPMLELGAESAELHRNVGAQAARQGVDALYVVGREAAPLGEGAKAFGMPGENVHDVADDDELTDMLARDLHAGDAVLFKASRAVGLESVAGNVIERLLSRAAV